MNPVESVASLGIVFPKLYPCKERALENLIKLLEDPFFTTIELSYIADAEIRQKMKYYLDYSCVDTIFNGGDAFRELSIDLSSTDKDTKKNSVEKCKMLINHCYEMNSKIMHIVTGKFLGDDCKNQNIDAFIESTIGLCKTAKQQADSYELCISLEIGDRYLDRKYLLGPTSEAVNAARIIQSECSNFGLLLDQSHLPVMQENSVRSLWLAKDYLTHIHLGNCFIKDPSAKHFGDKHIPFGVANSEVGISELTEFIKTLDVIGFFNAPKPTRRPVVTFEVGCLADEPQELVLANVKRVFNEAWAKA